MIKTFKKSKLHNRWNFRWHNWESKDCRGHDDVSKGKIPRKLRTWDLDSFGPATTKRGFIWIMLIGATSGPCKKCMGSSFPWKNDPRNAHTGIQKTYQRNHERPLALVDVRPFAHGCSLVILRPFARWDLRVLHHRVTWWRVCPSEDDARLTCPLLFRDLFSFRFSRLIACHTAPCANVSRPKKKKRKLRTRGTLGSSQHSQRVLFKMKYHRQRQLVIPGKPR